MLLCEDCPPTLPPDPTDGIALVASGLGAILVRQLLKVGSGGFFVRFTALAVVLVGVIALHGERD